MRLLTAYHIFTFSFSLCFSFFSFFSFSPSISVALQHGLHVSGLSPGDDVFATISPGESLLYSFQLPENHMGGTFFYHPHHHGSVSLQLGGGACGLIIVEDEPGSLPPQIMEMEDVPLVLNYLEVNRVKQLQNVYDSHLLNTVGGGAPTFLTNGQVAPVKAVEVGVWTRFRMLYTAMSHLLILSPEVVDNPTATCELQLIAKDGIYLNEAPRQITKIYLPEGGRADVAIRCTGEGQVNFMAEIEKRLTYVAFTLAPFIPEPAVDDDILDDVIVKDDSIVKDDVIVNDDSIVNDDVIVNDDSIVNDDANSIDDIVGDDAATTPVILSDEEIAALLRAPVLTPFSVYRPCYLVDTRSSIPTTHEDLVLGTGNPNTKLNGVPFLFVLLFI
jgi:FtsP/CotA-like multicopper oxidase with cupredoxin domain